MNQVNCSVTILDSEFDTRYGCPNEATETVKLYGKLEAMCARHAERAVSHFGAERVDPNG